MELSLEEKLARSLTWETAELLPFLPYLLQDLWDLGSNSDVTVELIKKHADISGEITILDLACGKGAVAVKAAQRLRVKAKGIDLIPEFIAYAEEMAKDFHVDDLCRFVVADINEAIKTEEGYDCVVYGAVGSDVLGGPAKTLEKLKGTVKPGGYILMGEGYFLEGENLEDIGHYGDVYLPEKQWLALFKDLGLTLSETVFRGKESTAESDSNLAAIAGRTEELIEKFPDKRAMFEGYLRSQHKEDAAVGGGGPVFVTWVLKTS